MRAPILSLAAALALAPIAARAGETPDPAAHELRFEANESGNDNLFYQSTRVAYHVRLTDPPHPRILFSFPAGDSGILLAFDVSQPENAQLKWTPERSGPWEDGSIRGASVFLRSNRPALVLTEAILDSMRLIRDEPMNGQYIGDRLELARLLGLDASGWAEPDVRVEGSLITLRRRTLDNANHYEASLRFEGNPKIETLADGSYRVSDPQGKPLRATIQAGCDYPTLTPFPVEELLAPDALKAYEDATAASPLKDAVDRFRFLVYREKMLAGSHRFLTYFGRDTMLSVLLAWPQLTPSAHEAALRSVLDRTSPEGRVAHEEDIGGQAERRRVEDALGLARSGDLAAAREALKKGQEPLYDYKMEDGEPLLVLFADRYLNDPATQDEEKRRLLDARSSQGETYRSLLARVMRDVLEEALPYARARSELEARTAKPSGAELRALATHLVKFRHPTVGDWRDSDAGNGYGIYSGGLNAILFPRALQALSQTARAAGIDPKTLSSEDPERVAAAWAYAPKHFEITLSSAEARYRLANFLAGVSPIEHDGLEARLGDLSSLGPIRFRALSLNREGEPVPILNSDGVFDLLLGRPSPEQLKEELAPFLQPFPLGLATDVGAVAADPAFSDRPDDYAVFNRNAYHGSVVWGWQQTALAVGASLQADRMAAAGDAAMEHMARQTAAAARAAVQRAGSYANLELWTFAWSADGQQQAAPFALGPNNDNESNPVQLWTAAGFAALIQNAR